MNETKLSHQNISDFQLAANLSIDVNTMLQREHFTTNERCLLHNTPHCSVNEGSFRCASSQKKACKSISGLELLICDMLGTTGVVHDGAIVLCANESEAHKTVSKMKPIAVNIMRRHALNVNAVEVRFPEHSPEY